MFEELKGVPRLLMHVDLKPIQGDRFQPTGFANLGAAVYERPGESRMLLVESAQSMANRLEHVCLDGDGPDVAPELKGLPYVRVKVNASVGGGKRELITSSLVEAHRLNSPFIIANQKFAEELSKKAGYASIGQIDWRQVAKAFFSFDPSSLLHGVFMANLGDGRMRFPRAISAFIEAEDAREANSGGVKNNPLDPTGKLRAEGLDRDVYSNVPYHRTEFTAGRIVAYFNLDLALLAGYGLPDHARELLVALGLYKIRRLLAAGLRLRTACDLIPLGDVQIDSPGAFKFPDENALLKAVQSRIAECAKASLFTNPAVTEISVNASFKEKKTNNKKDEADVDQSGTDDDQE